MGKRRLLWDSLQAAFRRFPQAPKEAIGQRPTPFEPARSMDSKSAQHHENHTGGLPIKPARERREGALKGKASATDVPCIGKNRRLYRRRFLFQSAWNQDGPVGSQQIYSPLIKA